MTDNKTPKTTMESILDQKELKTFLAAKTTWQGLTKDTINMLKKVSKVGAALNMLYDKGTAKGLKKNQLANMASDHFPGLTDVDRSVYRKLTQYTDDIIKYVNSTGVKSDNPRYLFNKYMTELNALNYAAKEAEAAQRLNTTNPQLIIEELKKAGLKPKPKPKKRTEPKQNPEQTLKSICSDVRKAISSDILNQKQLAQIERELTMTLALIHSINETQGYDQVANS